MNPFLQALNLRGLPMVQIASFHINRFTPKILPNGLERDATKEKEGICQRQSREGEEGKFVGKPVRAATVFPAPLPTNLTLCMQVVVVLW